MAKKILFISHVLDKSGAPRSLLSLLKLFPYESGYVFDVLAMRRDGLKSAYLKYLGKTPIIITRNPPKGKFAKLVERIFSLPLLLITLLRIKPELVVVNSAANSRAILLSKLLGFKVCVFVREYEEMFVSLARFRMTFVKLADKVFVTNDRHGHWVREKIGYKGEMAVIPNGIDLEEINILQKESPSREFLEFVKRFKFVVGCAGFITERKGWRFFLTLMQNLKKRKDIGFVIVGDFVSSKEKEEFLLSLKKTGIEKRCFITGIRENVFSYYKNLDLMAITSVSEVFSRVVLECFALGIPLLSFKIRGIVSQLPEDYPLMVQPFNMEDFTEKTIVILDKVKERKRLADCLKRERIKYSIAEIAKNFYKELLGEYTCYYENSNFRNARDTQ